MLLPTPGGDDEKAFVARCMGDAHMNDKFPDQAQRAAVCYKQYRGVAKMAVPTESRVSFKKFDAKKQIAYGEVYVPFVPDSQGDYMTPEEIERVAHNFLKKGAVAAIDTEHDMVRNGSSAVESFISRSGDPDFPVPGSWVLGVHIPNKDAWAKTESGEIGGFSMYGTGRRQQRIVEIEVPDEGVLFGKTADTSGNGAHGHLYALDFDHKGNFLGGETDDVNGHTHVIKKGTVTEPGPDGHRHRFSFIDALAKGETELTDEQREWQRTRLALRKSDWNESEHPRGKTTPESRGGSFAPKGTSITDGGSVGGGGIRPTNTEWKYRDAAGKEHLGYVLQVSDKGGSDVTHAMRDSATGELSLLSGSLLRGAGVTGKTVPFHEIDQKVWDARAPTPAARPVELTPSGHRPLSTIAREIRRDWGPKVYFGAKPYLDALSSMYDVKDKYYEDSGKSVVAYLLGNMTGWRGEKAREIKAELKKIIGVKKGDMSAEDMPEMDGAQDEAQCKDCNTPKRCKKEGRCMIADEESAAEDTKGDEAE